MQQIISSKRYVTSSSYCSDMGSEYRSAFMADYDRIIFSNPFRRLSKKTQVHPLSRNDHVHNRLTHSLEVASVGRTLGAGVSNKLKGCKKEDLSFILQSACLAHDIGNPPFGHAGEEVIKSWFKDRKNDDLMKNLTKEELNDFVCFDGNAQSIRVVTNLENHPKDGGMRLTLSTLATMVKYPWHSLHANSKGKKFSFFQSEKEIKKVLFEEFDINENIRYPLSFLLEAADDICYSLLDIKDAIEIGMIELKDLQDVFLLLCKEAYSQTMEDKKLSELEKTSRLCAISINNLSLHVIDIFELKNLKKAHELIDLFENEKLKQGLLLAKNMGREHIFNEKRKTELEIGAYNIIGVLLEEFIHTAYSLHVNNLTFKDERILTLMGHKAPQKSYSLYEKYQSVVDYIVGMTDNYATNLAQKIRGTYM